MTPDQNCYKLIENFEELRLKAYPDAGGVWTIGYGTTEYPNGALVKQGDTCTEQEADTWLELNADYAASLVDKALFGATISQAQFNALTSLSYNIGTGAFRGSHLLQAILANPSDPIIFDYSPVNPENGLAEPHCCRFLDWVYVKSRVNIGLISRRMQEADLYKSGIA